MELGDAAEDVTRNVLSSPDVDVRLRAGRILESIAAGRLEPDVELTAVVLLAFAAAGYSHRSRDEFDACRTYGDVVGAGVKWLVARNTRGALGSYAIAEMYALTGDKTLECEARALVRELVQCQAESGAWGDGWTTWWSLLALDVTKELVDNTGRVVRAMEWLSRHATDPVLALHAHVALARHDKKPFSLAARLLCRAADPSRLTARQRLMASWTSCFLSVECRAWRKRWRAMREREGRAAWSDLERCAFDGWTTWWGARDFHHRSVFGPRD